MFLGIIIYREYKDLFMEKLSETDPNNDHILEFSSVMTIDHIQELYQALKKILTLNCKSVTFIGSNINKIDTATLQLLYSFVNAAKKKGISWQWQSCSSVLLENVNLLGLASELKLTGIQHGKNTNCR